MTYISSTEQLIAGALGGDLSDMDEAYTARLLHPVRFKRLDGSDISDIRTLVAGTKVLADPTVEPRHRSVYAVINWEVFVGDAYEDELEEASGPIPMVAALPRSAEATVDAAFESVVRRAYGGAGASGERTARASRVSVEHEPQDLGAALLAVLGHSIA